MNNKEIKENNDQGNKAVSLLKDVFRGFGESYEFARRIEESRNTNIKK